MRKTRKLWKLVSVPLLLAVGLTTIAPAVAPVAGPVVSVVTGDAEADFGKLAAQDRRSGGGQQAQNPVIKELLKWFLASGIWDSVVGFWREFRAWLRELTCEDIQEIVEGIDLLCYLDD